MNTYEVWRSRASFLRDSVSRSVGRSVNMNRKKNIERRRIIFPRLCNAVDTFDDKRCDVNSGASIQAADSEKCQADASSVCN